MPDINVTVSVDWPASPTHTFATETEVVIRNRFGLAIGVATTSDDTAPTRTPSHGDAVAPGEFRVFTFPADARLWLAFDGRPNISAEPLSLHAGL